MMHLQDRSAHLTPHDEWFAGVLTQWWQQQSEWDQEDFASLVVCADMVNDQKARITTKQDGIIAGIDGIGYILEQHTDVSAKMFVTEGQEVSAGDTLCELRGNAHELLNLERTIVNLLGLLSGIATLTKQAVQKINDPNVLLLPTRKTMWGAIDKVGVVAGGGGTHRLNSADALIFKENHIIAAGGLEKTLENIKSLVLAEDGFWEVEVENEQEFYSVFDQIDDLPPTGIIMLDNFTPDRIIRLLSDAKASRDLPASKKVIIEASGGITMENLSQYAQTGVDSISCGFLTNSAKVLDISLRLVE